MSNYRTDIREAVKTQLIGRTIAASNVFTSRAKPITPETMPAVLVYLGEARRNEQELDMSLFRRHVALVIEGALTSSPEAIELDLENFADQLEKAIEFDRTLGNLVIDTRWQSTEPDIVSSGRVLVGAVRVEYEVQVYTNERIFPGMGIGTTDFLPTTVEVVEPKAPTPYGNDYVKPALSHPDPIPDFLTAPEPGFLHGAERT